MSSVATAGSVTAGTTVPMKGLGGDQMVIGFSRKRTQSNRTKLAVLRAKTAAGELFITQFEREVSNGTLKEINLIGDGGRRYSFTFGEVDG